MSSRTCSLKTGRRGTLRPPGLAYVVRQVVRQIVLERKRRTVWGGPALSEVEGALARHWQNVIPARDN
jgi:hypothetical protein